MALTVWTQPSGSLGTFQEGLNFELTLPVNNDSGVTYSKISGELPSGLWMSNNRILGTPSEVVRDTISTFCIRASKNNQISDRTFSITVTGPDDPIILTSEGLLDVGIYKQLYVVDNAFVNYQIDAIDADTSAGQKLTYFISSGSLPPGLSLTPDGVIYGVVDSVTTLQPTEGNGSYDHGYFDVGPYDFASPQRQNGYDELRYDYIGYDYFFINQPRTLNRTYEFIVTVTDGDTLTPPKKTFQIYVVNPATFRADSESLVSNSKWFNADVSYIQAPVWLTPSDLGIYRANNYITIVLDVFDTKSVYYEIDDITNLPPNMNFDIQTGEIFGRVPAQSAITIEYTFTVTAIRYGDVDTSETNRSSKTFTLKIIGEIDSVISWNTPSNLGNISAGYVSTFKINASSSILNSEITYLITNGELPPGLTLSYDGEILGTVSQFSNQIDFDNKTTFFDINIAAHRITFDNNTTIFDSNSTKIGINTSSTTFNKSSIKYGIISFDLTPTTKTTFDNNTTTIDRVFKFTVDAHDQYYLSAISKSFTITVDTPNNLNYSNIYVKPYMNTSHRATWSKFINDPSIFTPSSLYRQNDLEFGLQDRLSMLIYAGIETKNISDYTTLLNEKVKRFKFGNIEKAIAYVPGTTTSVYELIYVNMVDPLIEDTKYALDNVTMWRSEISKIGSVKWDYLPLWMRSVQPSFRKQLGFVLGVPICFCKSGTADSVLLNIKHSNFDFKLLDYTIDRFIITKVNGYDADKYIIFNNRNHV
jgi:Putative Ig domain